MVVAAVVVGEEELVTMAAIGMWSEEEEEEEEEVGEVGEVGEEGESPQHQI